MNQEYDLIFIRHAQSEINQATHAISKKYNVSNHYSVLKDYPQWINNVKYSIKYVDCQITQKGREQCFNSKLVTDKLNPQIILVSPLWRALQTCNILFGDRDIPIIVQPLLIQSIRSSSDLHKQSKEKTEKYKNFNFENVLNKNDYWGIQYDEENRENYRKKIIEEGAVSVEQKNKVVLDYMKETGSYQTAKNMRKRSMKIKELLGQYRQKYSKIAVVAHFNTINFTASKSFNEKEEPTDSLKIKNCEIHLCRLNDIIQDE